MSISAMLAELLELLDDVKGGVSWPLEESELKLNDPDVNKSPRLLLLLLLEPRLLPASMLSIDGGAISIGTSELLAFPEQLMAACTEDWIESMT
jgi:hypothetical protein